MKKEISQEELWYFNEKKEMPDHLHHTVISPMHYGDTLEIYINRGFQGEAIIGGIHFPFKEKNVFLVPPHAPHTYICTKGGSSSGDVIGAFHINIEKLKPFFNIEQMLLLDNRTLSSYETDGHDFDRIWAIISNILNSQRTFSARISDLLSLFESFKLKTDIQKSDMSYNSSVIRIVDWVEHHYFEKLTIERAAEHFGFSTYYFCKWFKTQTGITFNEYLSSVRISHACVFLKNGDSVTAVAQQCGFYDSSYFIKVFKRFMGITPLEYASKPK